MKPAVTMGGKEAGMVIQPDRTMTKQKRSGRKMRIVLATTSIVVLCACTISLGLYFGLANKDTVVEMLVYFNDDQGDVISTDVTVTQSEEYFSFENAAVVYDFSTGLTVYKSKIPGERYNGCLVESFNMTEMETPSDLKSDMQRGEVHGWTDFEEFRVTNVWLNGEALGPKSHDLCADEEIKFIERVGNTNGIDDDDDIEDEDLPALGNGAVEIPKTRLRRRLDVHIKISIRIRIRF